MICVLEISTCILAECVSHSICEPGIKCETLCGSLVEHFNLELVGNDVKAVLPHLLTLSRQRQLLEFSNLFSHGRAWR